MKIAENVELLELKSERGSIYPVLLWDGHDLVLIDAGMPGETGALRAAVEAAGHKLEDITKAILTHQDLDHVGGARALSEMGVELYAHETEAPYIQGDQTSIRLADMEARLDELSEEERAFYERVKAGAQYFYAGIDRKVKDGDVLGLCGGIRILHTPGHTPGHMAVLLMESNILVAGDAANIAEGKLVGADPAFSTDLEAAAASLRKIIGAGAKAVVCYHGGMVNRE